MTETAIAPASTSPPASSALVAPPPMAPRSPWPWIIAGLLGLAGIGLGWKAYQRVGELEAELVKRQQDSQSQAQEARLLARQAQEQAREAAARAALLDTRLAEVALQRGQVEDLIKSMSRSRDENLVVDIEAALRVAMQQSVLTGSAEPLVSALQTADERLARARQPRLEPVRRALARDLDKVKATGVSDLSSLAIRLDEAVRLVDEAPLLSEPPRPAGLPRASRAAREAARPGAARAQSALPGPASAAVPATGAEQPWHLRLLDWGQQASQVVWQEARGLIRLTRIDKPEAMLIAPEQAFVLRENLKLRLLNARLNLLSRQTGAASADIHAVQDAVQRYFDPQSRKTQLLAEQLGQLGRQSLHIQLPRPEDTLAALATVAGGR